MPLVANSRPLPFDLPSEPARTALVLIDFQGDFCHETGSFLAAVGAPSGTRFTRQALPAAREVLRAARRAGIRVVHTLEAHLPDLSDLTPSKDRRSRHADAPHTGVIGRDGGNGRMLVRGSRCNGLMDHVAMTDGEIAIHKPGKGAFCDTELRARLDEWGVTHLIFCGVTTECCVQTTMREANDRGFDSILVEDATASCVPRMKTETIGQVTAFGALVGCSATSHDVVQVLLAISKSPMVSSSCCSPQASPTVASLPVIDVSCLLGTLHRPFAQARRAVNAECLQCARQIDDACRRVGFFYVTGHGLRPPLDAAREFFALDVAAKLRLRAATGEGAGYEPSGAQILDEGRLGDGIDGTTVQVGDRKESFIVGKSVPSQRIDGTTTSSRIEGRWPEESADGPVRPGFRERIVDYHDQCENFLRILLRGTALGLGLAADTFDCFTRDAMTKARLLRYPAFSADPSYAHGAPGCGSHCDWGALTLLAQDDVGGLEVFCDGKWLRAPNREGALLVNVGDMLKLWSGGRYRSAPHRVLRPKSENTERYSIVVFYNCDFDAPIDPNYLLPNTSGAVDSPMVPLTAEQYILERVKGTYGCDNMSNSN